MTKSRFAVKKQGGWASNRAGDPGVPGLARRRTDIEELTRRHHAYLCGLARRLCRGESDPDDLVQDLFEKLMQRVEPIPPVANERAWLSRILTNLFLDKLRRRRARREDPLDEPAELPPPETAWWQQLTIEQIHAALARLPADQRVTFELFSFEGRSYDAIAADLGIAKATVGSRILRVRDKLRALLSAEQTDD